MISEASRFRLEHAVVLLLLCDGLQTLASVEGPLCMRNVCPLFPEEDDRQVYIGHLFLHNPNQDKRIYVENIERRE
jgi:hypothetical protein